MACGNGIYIYMHNTIQYRQSWSAVPVLSLIKEEGTDYHLCYDTALHIGVNPGVEGVTSRFWDGGSWSSWGLHEILLYPMILSKVVIFQKNKELFILNRNSGYCTLNCVFLCISDSDL